MEQAPVKGGVQYKPSAEAVRDKVAHGMSLMGYRSSQAVATIIASELAANIILMRGGNDEDAVAEIVGTIVAEAFANYRAVEAKQVRN